MIAVSSVFYDHPFIKVETTLVDLPNKRMCSILTGIDQMQCAHCIANLQGLSCHGTDGTVSVIGEPDLASCPFCVDLSHI